MKNRLNRYASLAVTSLFTFISTYVLARNLVVAAETATKCFVESSDGTSGTCKQASGQSCPSGQSCKFTKDGESGANRNMCGCR